MPSQTINLILWICLLAYPISFTYHELFPKDVTISSPSIQQDYEEVEEIEPSTQSNPFAAYPGLLNQHLKKPKPLQAHWSSPDPQGDEKFLEAIAAITNAWKEAPSSTDSVELIEDEKPDKPDEAIDYSYDPDEVPPGFDEDVYEKDNLVSKKPGKVTGKVMKKPVKPVQATPDEAIEETEPKTPSASTKSQAIKLKLLEKLSELKSKYPLVYQDTIQEEANDLASLKQQFLDLKQAIKTHLSSQAKKVQENQQDLLWIPPPPKNLAHTAINRVWDCSLSDPSKKIKFKGKMVAVDDRPTTPITLYSPTQLDIWNEEFVANPTPSSHSYLPACLSYDGKRCLYGEDYHECQSMGVNAPKSRGGLLVCPSCLLSNDCGEIPPWCIMAWTNLPTEPVKFLNHAAQTSARVSADAMKKSVEEEEKLNAVLSEKFGDQSAAGVPAKEFGLVKAPSPTYWQCLSTHHTPVTIVSGEASCASQDGSRCIWFNSHQQCLKAIKDPKRSKLRYIISCGEHHNSLYGWTGYGKADYWCDAAKTMMSA